MGNEDHIAYRIAAAEALISILIDGKTSDGVISNISKKYSLTDRDRAAMAEIVYGTLKNLSFLDYVLQRLLTRGKFPSIKATMGLRIGAYQIAFGNVPPYAAVDSTIEVLKHIDCHAREISLVNAVLKKFAQQWQKIKLPDDVVKFLAVKYSHPQWIVARWVERYGIDITEKILQANNAFPPKLYRINPLKTSLEKLEGEYSNISRTIFPEYFELHEKTPAKFFKPLLDGLVSVQDPAFGIPVKILQPKFYERILEIGSAPGGKSTHIAEMLGGDARNLYALDISFKKCMVIADNFDRLGIDMPAIICADGSMAPFRENAFDKVLIDAPCTAWGIVRRHPEIKWHRKLSDAQRLAKLQEKLIVAAHKLLKIGGLLVFTTCTTEPEENQGAVQTALGLGMRLDKIESIPEEFIEAEGFIARTWNYRDNFDCSFTFKAIKVSFF